MANMQAAASCLQRRWIRSVYAGRRVADGGMGWRSAEERPPKARAKVREGSLMQIGVKACRAGR